MPTKYQAPSVRKAFLVLRLISKANQGAGISQLANSLGMSKGTVYGIIRALEEIGALIRDPTSKKYTLGPTLFELGKSAYTRLDLGKAARPVMKNLMERTGASVFVGILNGQRVTILDVVESNQDLKITAPRGSTIPLLAGATGKVFLAAMDRVRAERIIRKGLPRFTDHSVTDPEQYILELEATRKNGYAVDDEEYIAGVRAAAAPLQPKQGKGYAIWAVGFKSALSDEKMAELASATLEAARNINGQLKDQL
ncbi:MAG: IclR family transcriptional regulator [Deltaproteobacteria bacterium]|nr:IclR family transcriptional regulator [Deltaproteobacteria bacterium]